MEEKNIETQVEKILNTRTVSRAQELMGSRSGLWLVAIVSFLESALPIPLLTDPFLVAAIAFNRSQTFLITIITIISSVLGGIVAFFSALFFFDLILQYLSPETAYSLVVMTSDETRGTFILTIIGAFTPVPYTFVAWAVAVLGGNLFIFIIASTVGRATRYGIISWLVYRFGPMAVIWAKRSIGLTSVVIFVLAGLYLWLKM